MRVLRRLLLLILLQLSLLVGGAAAQASLAGAPSFGACAAMSAPRDCAGMPAGKPSAKHAAMGDAAACGSAACAQACLPLFIQASSPEMAVLPSVGVRVAAQPVLFPGPVLPPPLRPPLIVRS